MTDNYRQFASVELTKAIAHLDACLTLWSPSKGLSPKEENADDACHSWNKLYAMAQTLRDFQSDEGP